MESTEPKREAYAAGDRRLLRLASVASPMVAMLLIAIKLWGWLATASVAMLGSLADSLLDLVASLITFFAIRVALMPPDDEHRFGHGKSEAVAALSQGVLIVISAMVVVLEVVQRLLTPAAVLAPGRGIIVIAVSLLLTLALVVFQRWAWRRTGSQALAGDEAHYRADLAVGVGVGLAIGLGASPGLWWVDPAVGALVAAYLVHTATGIIRLALRDLLDQELPPAQRERIHRLIAEHEHVLGLHDLRTRRAGRQRFVQVHVELDPSLPLVRAHAIADEIEAEIVRRCGDLEVLIHLDPAGLEAPHDPRP